VPRREGYLDYNPNLKHRQLPEANKVASKGNIEHLGQAKNIVHQTRVASPTDYENGLGQALEKIFSDNVIELEDIISRLNKMGVQTQSGAAWTEESFRSEMKRLGA